jgi:hypothetical protein
MSSLHATDRRSLEKFLGMSSDYVLNFSEYTFGELVSGRFLRNPVLAIRTETIWTDPFVRYRDDTTL